MVTNVRQLKPRYLGKELERRVRLIHEWLDLEPIVVLLTSSREDGKEEMTLKEADESILRYKRFLELNLRYSGEDIVPAHDIDLVWHAHFSDTAKYREDCDVTLGFFLDHYPYFGLRGQEDAEALNRAFERTKTLYGELFGQPLLGIRAACKEHCGENDTLVRPRRFNPERV